jgi:hypothetical protein
MQSLQRDPGAGDRSGAGAAIGLDHVAIDGDLALAERDEIDHGAQLRPISRWISTVRPRCLPPTPRARCARRWRAATCRIRR